MPRTPWSYQQCLSSVPFIQTSPRHLHYCPAWQWLLGSLIQTLRKRLIIARIICHSDGHLLRCLRKLISISTVGNVIVMSRQQGVTTFKRRLDWGCRRTSGLMAVVSTAAVLASVTGGASSTTATSSACCNATACSPVGLRGCQNDCFLSLFSPVTSSRYLAAG
jgi:hypothetical protein